MPAQASAMSRRTGQSFVAIIGAFVIISILSYYAWSLSSEGQTLKRTVVLTYSKLKDINTQKRTLEKKNSLLSNRMVEMEESRDNEKQNAEAELLEKKKCENKRIRGEEENKNKVSKKQELLAKCEDASYQRENFLMLALNEVQLGSLDSEAQSDIIMAKIKHLKEKLKSTTLEYLKFQNKYSDLEKEKIRLEEENKKLLENSKKSAMKKKTTKVDKAKTSSGRHDGLKKKTHEKKKETKPDGKNKVVTANIDAQNKKDSKKDIEKSVYEKQDATDVSETAREALPHERDEWTDEVVKKQAEKASNQSKANKSVTVSQSGGSNSAAAKPAFSSNTQDVSVEATEGPSIEPYDANTGGATDQVLEARDFLTAEKNNIGGYSLEEETNEPGADEVVDKENEDAQRNAVISENQVPEVKKAEKHKEDKQSPKQKKLKMVKKHNKLSGEAILGIN